MPEDDHLKRIQDALEGPWQSLARAEAQKALARDEAEAARARDEAEIALAQDEVETARAQDEAEAARARDEAEAAHAQDEVEAALAQDEVETALARDDARKAREKKRVEDKLKASAPFKTIIVVAIVLVFGILWWIETFNDYNFAKTVATPVEARQGGKTPTQSPVPAASVSRLSWAEVLEEKPDPKIVRNTQFFNGITDTKLPWRVKDRLTGIEMLLVPPGKFTMGASPRDKQATEDEKPAHEVTITKAFYLGRTEVTQEQWMKLMDKNPSRFVGDKLPVECITVEEVRMFLNKVGGGLQLPTEAQWEYACRAGTTDQTYGDLDKIAWHRNAFSKTHPVGEKQANSLGFYDMIGNVNELCQDRYDGVYYKFCKDGVVDPTGSAHGKFPLLRGGNWNSDPISFRASYRFELSPNHGQTYPDYGFRVARNP